MYDPLCQYITSLLSFTPPPFATAPLLKVRVDSPVVEVEYTTACSTLYSQYRNVLDLLVSGTEQLVDFSESTYCPVYNLLYEQISTDYNHPTYGETVHERIEDLIYDIKFSDIPR